jgi:hypothetical protein
MTVVSLDMAYRSSASTAWANNARAPLRSTAVSGSVKFLVGRAGKR